MRASQVLLLLILIGELCGTRVYAQTFPSGTQTCGNGYINITLTPNVTGCGFGVPVLQAKEYTQTANITLTTTTGCSTTGSGPLTLTGVCLGKINCAPTRIAEEVNYPGGAGTANGVVTYQNEYVYSIGVSKIVLYACAAGEQVTWNATCPIPCCASLNPPHLPEGKGKEPRRSNIANS